MGFNKIAFFRYRQIDELLRTGRTFSLQELTNEIKKRLKSNYDIDYISERQIAADIKLLRSEPPSGYNAPIINIKNIGYKYSDRNFSITNLNYTNEEIEVIRNALLLLKYNNPDNTFDNRIKLLSKLSINTAELPYILKEPYAIGGNQFINDIIDAIQYKYYIDVTYQPYHNKTTTFNNLKPILLKEYRNRIYLIAIDDALQNRIVLALDRIENLTKCKGNFKLSNHAVNELINLYKSCIGTSIEYGQAPEDITLHVSNQLTPYFLSRPIHESQLHVGSANKNWHKFSLKVVTNIELISEILKYNKEVKVIKPKSLATKINNLISEMQKNYQ